MQDIIDEFIHKLRTPAVAIKISVGGIKEYLPKLVEAYAIGKDNGLDLPEINDEHLEVLTRILNNIERDSFKINQYLDDLTKAKWRETND